MKTTSTLVARYAETDRMGIIHHSVYPVWFEVARTDFIKQVGMTYSDMEKMGIMLPLAELNCRYFRPVEYEDEVSIEVGIGRLTPARIEFIYEVFVNGELCCRGMTLHGWTGKNLRPLNLKKHFPDVYALVASTKDDESPEVR